MALSLAACIIFLVIPSSRENQLHIHRILVLMIKYSTFHTECCSAYKIRNDELMQVLPNFQPSLFQSVNSPNRLVLSDTYNCSHVVHH